MAVLTAITLQDVEVLASAYALGKAQQLEGIAAGSVNSNFAVEVGGRRFFLRIYEEQDFAGAKRETAMLERLAGAGVPTPAPLRRADGALVAEIHGKPAALFPWRSGAMRCQSSVSTEDARRVGAALAHVHVAGAAEPCDRGRFGYSELLKRIDAIGSSGDRALRELAPTLREALAAAHRARPDGLPGGLTHGDLFRDNVLWDGSGEIAALLDFESACAGTYAYDLMVTVLSWCVGDELDGRLASAMRDGYESVRALTRAEGTALLPEGRFACLRFTITRITDYALRADVAGPRVVKDWRRFWRRFQRLEALGTTGVQQALGLAVG